MATLYIDRKNIELRADRSCLIIYQQGQKNGTVPFSQIDSVVISQHTLLDTRVLGSLTEHQIGLTVIHPINAARTVNMPGYSHNDISRRLSQYALVKNPQRCEQWAHYLVLHKIKNQYRLITRLLLYRVDKRYTLTRAQQSLKKTIQILLSKRNLDINGLRGYEGAAAASYFQAFTQVFAPALAFTERNRRPPLDPVNACLSLGYTLLHASAIRACHIAGLEPMMGFYHQPLFSRESLASDMIEPLRPEIDYWVWKLFREKKLTTDHFYYPNQACLLNKSGRKLFYNEFQQIASRLQCRLRFACRLMLRNL